MLAPINRLGRSKVPGDDQTASRRKGSNGTLPNGNRPSSIAILGAAPPRLLIFLRGKLTAVIVISTEKFFAAQSLRHKGRSTAGGLGR